jgi:hypothetical protein
MCCRRRFLRSTAKSAATRSHGTRGCVNVLRLSCTTRASQKQDAGPQNLIQSPTLRGHAGLVELKTRFVEAWRSTLLLEDAGASVAYGLAVGLKTPEVRTRGTKRKICRSGLRTLRYTLARELQPIDCEPRTSGLVTCDAGMRGGMSLTAPLPHRCAHCQCLPAHAGKTLWLVAKGPVQFWCLCKSKRIES